MDGKKTIRKKGYAFIDESGRTIIIVYGEGRRDLLKKYFDEPGDVLGIKYQTISPLF